MPEPNPVWGVHVVEGAVTAALVRRTESGRFEILDALAERAPEDPVLALRQAQGILSRRSVAAPGAIVTLPDANGCVVTATVPPEELDLSEHEISNEMYEWTRFEPGEAELRHTRIVHGPRREERLVAAIPRGDYRRFLEVLETRDLSRMGVGMSGVALWRGATALGLVPPDGFLVATLAHVAEVYVAPGGRARRHLLPLGESDIARDATAVDLLARDLLQLADYHRSLRRTGERPSADPKFVLAGLSATSPAVRLPLAAVLGPRLLDEPAAEPLVAPAPGARLPAVPLAALAGAVGAALEALRPTRERLVLRHLPADLPPYRRSAPLGAVAVGILALAGVFLAWRRFETAPPAHVADAARAPAPADATRPAKEIAPRVTAEPDAAGPPRPPGVPGPPATPAVVEASSAGPGRVLVRWPSGNAGRGLTRRFLGLDGSDPDRRPSRVGTVDAAAGEVIDDVPGPSGLYEWVVEGTAPVRAFVEVRVDLELLGPGEAGRARFVLHRPWRGGTATLEVEVAPGERIAAADGMLTFESGWRLDAVRTRSESERAAVRVPRFLPDGRIERGGDGAPVTGERVVERERRIFEADAAAADGERRTWLRKMTDG